MQIICLVVDGLRTRRCVYTLDVRYRYSFRGKRVKSQLDGWLDRLGGRKEGSHATFMFLPFFLGGLGRVGAVGQTGKGGGDE